MPHSDIKTAASRRDFSINAIYYNPINQEINDPFNGQSDLNNKQLRHISSAFTEDSLRVYRAIQFAARFDVTIHPSTIELYQKMDTSDLPKERIFEEIKKCLLRSKKTIDWFQVP